MTWSALMWAFLVSHVVGDVLLQTEWQAAHKDGGLGRDPVARRALLTHVTTYTAAFIPALVWIGGEQGTLLALILAAAIFVPHLVTDDGRPVRFWLRAVKRSPPQSPMALTIAVDQSIHVVCLFAAALVAAA